MHIKKSRGPHGPSILPWGTPQVDLLTLDTTPLTLHFFLYYIRRTQNILSNGHTNVPEHLSKMPEDHRRLPTTFEEHPKIFRPYFHKFKYSLREQHYIRKVIEIFTSEDMKNMPLESRMWFCINFTSDVSFSRALVCIYHMPVPHKDRLGTTKFDFESGLDFPI